MGMSSSSLVHLPRVCKERMGHPAIRCMREALRAKQNGLRCGLNQISFGWGVSASVKRERVGTCTAGLRKGRVPSKQSGLDIGMKVIAPLVTVW